MFCACGCGQALQTTDVRKKYVDKKHYKRAKDRRYVNTPRGREVRRRAVKKYQKSAKGCRQASAAIRRRRDEDPVFRQKDRARLALRRAVELGVIKKPLECQGKGPHEGRLEAHHYAGYEFANYLKVVWLCHKCHVLVEQNE